MFHILWRLQLLQLYPQANITSVLSCAIFKLSRLCRHQLVNCFSFTRKLKLVLFIRTEWLFILKIPDWYVIIISVMDSSDIRHSVLWSSCYPHTAKSHTSYRHRHTQTSETLKVKRFSIEISNKKWMIYNLIDCVSRSECFSLQHQYHYNNEGLMLEN